MAEVSASSLLKQARRLKRRVERDRLGAFIAEGPQVLQMAIERSFPLVAIFTTDDDLAKTYEASQSAPVFVINEDEFASISDTVTPQGVLAIAKTPKIDIKVIDQASKLFIYVEEVRDPGNLGTIIRTADAAGAGAVLLSPGSVDPFNDKVVRSSAGSIFNIPVIGDLAIGEIQDLAESIQANILVTTLDGKYSLFDLNQKLTEPTIWIIGNEAAGVSEQAMEIATYTIKIPIFGLAESLNAAVAASVCLYASAERIHEAKA